jgi:hypothetical protein
VYCGLEQAAPFLLMLLEVLRNLLPVRRKA